MNSGAQGYIVPALLVAPHKHLIEFRNKYIYIHIEHVLLKCIKIFDSGPTLYHFLSYGSISVLLSFPIRQLKVIEVIMYLFSIR